MVLLETNGKGNRYICARHKYSQEREANSIIVDGYSRYIQEIDLYEIDTQFMTELCYTQQFIHTGEGITE